MTGTATYLYAITRPIPQAALTGVAGVSGTAVRVIEHDEISCVVSTVGLSDFGEQALAAHLEDLDWLARTAREHDDVVRATARLTTTVPLRMATVCRDDAAVHARLDTMTESLAAVLPELDGCDEWGVKVYAPPSVDTADGGDEASSGTSYLLQRRRQLEREHTATERAVHEAEIAFDRLAEVAVASRRHRPQDQRLTGHPHPMVLNAAFLVARAGTETFQSVVADLAQRHPAGALVLTGPWPPYSFVPDEQS